MARITGTTTKLMTGQQSDERNDISTQKITTITTI